MKIVESTYSLIYLYKQQPLPTSRKRLFFRQTILFCTLFPLLRQRLNRLVFRKVGVKLCLVRVALRLDDLVDHVDHDGNVCRERHRAEDRVDHGVIRGLHELDAAILKQREGLGEHAPDG